MGKVTKVGGNMLKNFKVGSLNFDTKDPSMWLNGVIILLILVVFILLAVQVFTPRKDLIDGFHTIAITNRNLPWPFNDVKFDPIYYSLVFAGKTKNGSAHGAGRVYFSKSFLPVDKNRIPGAVAGAGYSVAGGSGGTPNRQQSGLAGTDGTISAGGKGKFNRGGAPGDGVAWSTLRVDPKIIERDNLTDAEPRTLLQADFENLVKINEAEHVLIHVFANLKTKSHTKKNIDLTFWEYTAAVVGGAAASVKATRIWGTTSNFDDNVYMPVSVLKKYLDLARDEDLEKIPVRAEVTAAGGTVATLAVTKQQLKDLEERLKISNYQNFVDQRHATTEATLVLFEGNWKDGKLTVARITDCGATGGETKFSIFYNDKEQVEDDSSVQNAVQFLRTPLYAYCMGA